MTAIETRIAQYEMAFRMQFAVPDVFDTAKESKPTLDLYGKSEFAKGCLIARRLVKRGVRMVQLSHSISGYDIAWDTGHGDIKGGHAHLARECDQGIAGFRVDGVPGLGPIVDDGGDGAVLLHSYCHWISSRFSAKDATLPLRKRQLGS